MGKPRMIILIRHAQSEGNKNRQIHQYIPDHRVKLTAEGWKQAEEAGRRLRSLLKPDDTIQFFTSPYRRTRETAQGILSTLTTSDQSDPCGPSPFQRENIKVYEEPRLREQDFGNFQPCSAEMERMWQERADYGHFFYRIPNGESAADAYDRISGFNESLWRQFGDEDFPSVCVLVTHGLMTRVFLMKWYHWSVEYFEDLRNVNHCEFIAMKQSENNGKFILQNSMRTWSELKRRAAALNAEAGGNDKGTNATPKDQGELLDSADVPTRRWGGCANGCNHAHLNYPNRPRRQNTIDYLQQPVKHDISTVRELQRESDDHPIASQDAKKHGAVPRKGKAFGIDSAIATKDGTRSRGHGDRGSRLEPIYNDQGPESPIETPSTAAFSSEAEVADSEASRSRASRHHQHDDHRPGKMKSLSSNLLAPDSSNPARSQRPNHFHLMGRDFGGSHSGVSTPADILSADSNSASDLDGFDSHATPATKSQSKSLPIQSQFLSRNKRSMTRQELEEESGMNGAARADALGDAEDEGDIPAANLSKEINDGSGKTAGGDTLQEYEGWTEEDIEKAKEENWKSFAEIY
ncbi:phosphoglycerate mutase-like protein [Eremomyces bilateralis CBS 781.70]|uniref:Phosphoglycerate mutase-like protein n=1 Tax=Eremomyces bilateralis CBS 781.70 TaxID=1392243 RepID=A0A6G1FV72_9PEZI|nr:phosphoglycerate mutase-like protein [Eremomyces bilateralis CBS 781.70]KAF1809795.1 phosphoglycerate mutase-like protein [Eremomyces bilateralis CBS 781.70]